MAPAAAPVAIPRVPTTSKATTSKFQTFITTVIDTIVVGNARIAERTGGKHDMHANLAVMMTIREGDSFWPGLVSFSMPIPVIRNTVRAYPEVVLVRVFLVWDPLRAIPSQTTGTWATPTQSPTGPVCLATTRLATTTATARERDLQGPLDRPDRRGNLA